MGGQPSYLSQEPPGEVFFGTGDAARVDRLEIRWPSGRTQAFEGLPVRATVEITEGGAPKLTAAADETGGHRPRARPASAVAFAGCRQDRAARRRGPAARGRARLLGEAPRGDRGADAPDCAAAAALYEQALALDPRHEDALYYLGQCRRELGQPAAARAAFERLVSVNPQSARGHLALGALLASPDPAEPMDLAPAEAHLRRAHAINGEETGPVVRLGEVLLVSGRAGRGPRVVRGRAADEPEERRGRVPRRLRGLGRRLRRRGPSRPARRREAATIDAPVKGVLSEGDRTGREARRRAAARQAPWGGSCSASRSPRCADAWRPGRRSTTRA